MACLGMRQEWQQINQEIMELMEDIRTLTETKEEIMEDIHQESHRLINLQRMMSGKAKLTPSEMAPLLMQASRTVIARLRERSKQEARHLVPVLRK